MPNSVRGESDHEQELTREEGEKQGSEGEKGERRNRIGGGARSKPWRLKMHEGFQGKDEWPWELEEKGDKRGREGEGKKRGDKKWVVIRGYSKKSVR